MCALVVSDNIVVLVIIKTNKLEECNFVFLTLIAHVPFRLVAISRDVKDHS